MPVLDIDVDIAKAMYDVNVWGVIRTTQVFAELVIAAEGTIVIIGSIAGVMPYVFGGPPPPTPIYKHPMHVSRLTTRRIQLLQSRNPIHSRHPPHRNVSLQRQSPQHLHRRRPHKSIPQLDLTLGPAPPADIGVHAH